jgi:hypothetical protein
MTSRKQVITATRRYCTVACLILTIDFSDLSSCCAQGRTGTMISSYLLFKRFFNDAESAIKYFISKRLRDSEVGMKNINFL